MCEEGLFRVYRKFVMNVKSSATGHEIKDNDFSQKPDYQLP